MKKEIKLRDGREVLLLGTAHVSRNSVQEVRETLSSYAPDTVCVELDQARRLALKQKDAAWQNLDLISVIKRGRLFFLFAQAILANFQRKVAQENGIQAGDDMKMAMDWAEAEKINLSLVDRDINITLRRAWRKSSFWQKVRILSQVLAFPFIEDEGITEESLEHLKQEDALSYLMQDMSKSLPSIKSVLIDERDEYIASAIWLISSPRIAAILGAGHLEGVEKHLRDPELNEKRAEKNVKLLSEVPRASILSCSLPWMITIIFVGILIWVFCRGGIRMGLEGLKTWVLVNGLLAMLGGVLVGAHPLTWLIALLGAPFTSLSPLVGVGMLTALNEAYLRKPRVKDFIKLSEDVGSFKGFFNNRIARVFLVFLGTSLGSLIGTFWGLGILAKLGIS